MHTSTFLFAIAAPAAILAHVAPRQESLPAPAPVPTAPAAAPTDPAPAPTNNDNTMDHNPEPTATPTQPVLPSGYADLANCELAIDTLLKAFSLVPTPNAALSAFLATETMAVSDPCKWASDVPEGLQGVYSDYSSEIVSVLSVHKDLVTQLESCVDAGGASVTRAEIVTPLFALPECAQVSTTGGASKTTAGPNAGATTTRGFPGAAATTSSTAGVRATGVALAGVAAAALLGVAGAI